MPVLICKHLKYFVVALIISGLLACQSKTGKQSGPAKAANTSKQTVVNKKAITEPPAVAQITFVKYLDDGDYFQLLAKDGANLVSFINETDTSLTLNRGDKIQVTWKNGTITMPGDNDAETAAKLLIGVKKISDGPVSKFRKTYGKKIKYTWFSENEYTVSYLDKIYLLVEYYLSKTQNPLLQFAIKKHDELTYSIESKERDNRGYTVIGIAPIGPNGSNIVQWLYITEDADQIYEYDLPNDELHIFN